MRACCTCCCASAQVHVNLRFKTKPIPTHPASRHVAVRAPAAPAVPAHRWGSGFQGSVAQPARKQDFTLQRPHSCTGHALRAPAATAALPGHSGAMRHDLVYQDLVWCKTSDLHETGGTANVEVYGESPSSLASHTTILGLRVQLLGTLKNVETSHWQPRLLNFWSQLCLTNPELPTLLCRAGRLVADGLPGSRTGPAGCVTAAGCGRALQRSRQRAGCRRRRGGAFRCRQRWRGGRRPGSQRIRVPCAS